MIKTTKAKRKLSDFNFDYDGAAVALVGPSVGGAANGRTTLLTKSLDSVTDEDVIKASEVTVTLSIVDFLTKFFNLWYDDALVLALAMGYDVGDDGYSFTESSNDYEEYLQERVDAISIMKSIVLDVDCIEKAVGSLLPKDYLKVLKAQELFEQNFDSAVLKATEIKKSFGVPAEGVNAEKSVKSPPVEQDKTKEVTMSDFITKALHEEAVTKAVDSAVEKAVAPLQVELQKAKEQLEAVQLEKQEAITKARKEAVALVEKDEVKAEELFKSLEPLAQEAFDIVIKSLQAKDSLVDNSDLFVQKSASGEEVEHEEVNGTLALLKAKHITK